MSFEIGSRVRVDCYNETKRGVIAYINFLDDGSRTYDIIYENNNKDEENEVKEDRIYELLQLEYQCQYLKLTHINKTTNSSINNLTNQDIYSSLSLFKECGNNLFELKDYKTAYEHYMKVYKYIQDIQLSIGNRVLIKVGNGPTERYEIGIISDIQSVKNNENERKNERYDVIYDRVVNHSDEEENISQDRIIPIYQNGFTICHSFFLLKFLLFFLIEDTEDPLIALELQRSIFMNLSKTATKRKLKGWAVHWALLAFGLINGLIFLIFTLFY